VSGVFGGSRALRHWPLAWVFLFWVNLDVMSWREKVKSLERIPSHLGFLRALFFL
jgi:hypothetical protein